MLSHKVWVQEVRTPVANLSILLTNSLLLLPRLTLRPLFFSYSRDRPAPTVMFVEPAPVIEYLALAPGFFSAAPAPVTRHVTPAPADSFATPVTRKHFGSSHFLFERALCFSSVASFSGFVLLKCLQPNFVESHSLSWLMRTLLMMQSTQMCPITCTRAFFKPWFFEWFCFRPRRSGRSRGACIDSHVCRGIHQIRGQYPSQKTFQMLNQPLAVSQLVSQPWRQVRPLLHAVWIGKLLEFTWTQ